jgi:NDP-sugar pyrophosphorylase family protein
MTLQCAILAGGLGTRMLPATETVPKALLPVLGTPFVDWQLDLLASRGVRRVVCCVGHLGNLLVEHVGDGSRHGLEVRWADEGARRLGTAGALRLAVDLGLLDEAFLVLYGDSYLPIDPGPVEEAWRRSGLPALMTVLRNDDRWDRSNCVYRDGRVVLYDKGRPVERRGEMAWIDYGLSVFTRASITRSVPSGAVADLADVQRALSLDGRLAGCEVHQRFYEAGSPAGLRELEEHLRARAQARADRT